MWRRSSWDGRSIRLKRLLPSCAKWMFCSRKVAEAIRSIEVTEVTYYRWRSEYGGLKGDQVKRLKSLETENQRLRRAISDLTLEKLILKEAASGNF